MPRTLRARISSMSTSKTRFTSLPLPRKHTSNLSLLVIQWSVLTDYLCLQHFLCSCEKVVRKQRRVCSSNLVR